MDLEVIRQKIDALDKDLVGLIEQRMSLVSQVAAFKQETGKAIYDEKREAAVLAKVADRVDNKEFEPYILDSFADIMKASRSYQAKKLGLSESDKAQ